jgi:hypothetical protein
MRIRYIYIMIDCWERATAKELFCSVRGAGPFDAGQWGVANGISAKVFQVLLPLLPWKLCEAPDN